MAGLLEKLAYRVRGRGDAVGAVTALLRAADLSPRPRDRSRRLAEAAYIGADVTGDLRNVPRLLSQALLADPGQTDSPAVAVAAATFCSTGKATLIPLTAFWFPHFRLGADLRTRTTIQ